VRHKTLHVKDYQRLSEIFAALPKAEMMIEACYLKAKADKALLDWMEEHYHDMMPWHAPNGWRWMLSEFHLESTKILTQKNNGVCCKNNRNCLFFVNKVPLLA
jgi:hypothetical protein